MTPILKGEARGFSGEVELEGWVTASTAMAQNHNSSRSNRTQPVAVDGDADDDGLGDGTEDADEELELIHEYLGGEAVVAERFTVALPDAEIPGGNGSLREAVTPERLIEYLMGNGEGTDHAWGRINSAADGGGDCDDDDARITPGTVCGPSPHFVADVTGPVSTGGGLEAFQASDGTLLISNAPAVERGASVLVCPAEGEAYEPANLRSWGAQADDVPTSTTHQGRLNGMIVAQVTVQPPGCPHPFPALFYVGQSVVDEELIYSGGWIIDDSSLYEDAFTLLTMVDSAPVVGVDVGDLDGDGLDDVVVARGDTRRRIVMRRRRGARIDDGPVDELVERGVLSEEGHQGNDSVVRKKPGGRRLVEEDGYVLTHLALDAPVLHLVNADGASNEVKFKAGAELSKGVN
ncbi:hypothetical protein [Haloferax marinum]|uniref:hypothetical protein n=1 Tax=Haloferax marinum TaxID=2666143 RepID=UPI001E522B06|nr:hypothetical protein [Haloferax marinum]